MGGGIWLAMRGSGAKKDSRPPINASSEDEEKFIKYVYCATMDWRREPARAYFCNSNGEYREFIQSANLDELKNKH